jgi:hypothetical protein
MRRKTGYLLFHESGISAEDWQDLIAKPSNLVMNTSSIQGTGTANPKLRVILP